MDRISAAYAVARKDHLSLWAFAQATLLRKFLGRYSADVQLELLKRLDGHYQHLTRCYSRWRCRYLDGAVEGFFSFIENKLPEEERRWATSHYVLPPRFVLPNLRGGPRNKENRARLAKAVEDFDSLLPRLQCRKLRQIRSGSDLVRKTRIEGALQETWGDINGIPAQKLKRWASISLSLPPRKIAVEAAAWKNNLRSPSYLEKQIPRVREELRLHERVWLPIAKGSAQLQEKEDRTVRYTQLFLHKQTRDR